MIICVSDGNAASIWTAAASPANANEATRTTWSNNESHEFAPAAASTGRKQAMPIKCMLEFVVQSYSLLPVCLYLFFTHFWSQFALNVFIFIKVLLLWGVIKFIFQGFCVMLELGYISSWCFLTECAVRKAAGTNISINISTTSCKQFFSSGCSPRY